jgi:ribosomal protein L21
MKTEIKSKTNKTNKMAKDSKATKIGVIALNNMQYVVKEGETIETRLPYDTTDGKDVDVKLLAVIADGKIEYGKPFLTNKMNFEFGDLVLGEKVYKDIFQAKSRYRKRVGFRKKFIEFKLNSIS